MELTSSAFSSFGEIPRRHTCEGEDAPPPLSWRAVPAGAKSLALVVDDPDAPDPAAPRMTWVHWLVYNIDPAAAGLAQGGTALPAGAFEGLNDFKRTRYGGPCPPVGRHRYFFKLYALDTLLPPLHQPDKARIEQAMQGHVVAQATLVGTYQKGGR
jgi:hypothetical protein